MIRVLLLAILMGIISSPTHAEVPVQLIQVLCVPSLSLFELETFDLPDIDAPSKSVAGIFTVGKFVKAPVSCQLKAGKLRIVVKKFVGRAVDPADGSDCAQFESAQFDIELDGKEIDSIDDWAACHMSPYIEHHIRVTQFGLSHCETNFGPPDGGIITKCKEVDFQKSPIDRFRN